MALELEHDAAMDRDVESTIQTESQLNIRIGIPTCGIPKTVKKNCS